MRVLCPHCQKTVTIPNEKAEQPTTCPECGHIFNAPALMNALPDEPAPPPPVRQYTPPATSQSPPPPTAPSAATNAEAKARLTLPKTVVPWIGPVALILLFLLSFATWIAAAPGGNAVYTQSAWSVLGGGFSTDITGEKVLNRETDLRTRSAVSFSMLLVMLLLVPSVVIAAIDLAEEYITVPIPDAIIHLWPKRRILLAGTSAAIFVLLSLQLMLGLGLESAALAMAENRYVAPMESETSESKLKRDIERGVEVSRLGIRRTGWLWLAYLCSASAAIGFGLELGLQRRGDRPDPAMELIW